MLEKYFVKLKAMVKTHQTVPVEAWIAMAVGVIGMYVFASIQTIFPNWNKVIIYGFFFCLYLLLGGLLWAVLKEPISQLKLSAAQWLKVFVLLSIPASTIGYGLTAFLCQEQTIKTWDFSVYWAKLIEQTQSFSSDISGSIDSLIASFSSEYSDLAVIPLIPFGRHFGLEFYQYTFYVYVIYAVPVCLLFALYITSVYKRVTGNEARIWHLVVSGTIAFLCVPLLRPILLGYVDIVGLIFILLLLILALDWKWDYFSLEKNVLLAGLSLLLLLSRRWYAFFIVAYYFAFGVEYIFHCFATRKLDMKKALPLVVNLVFIAGICTIWILTVTPGTLTAFLGTNYSEAYTAYKVRSDLGDLLYFMKDCGLIFAFLSILGIILTLVNKGSRLLAIRWITIFLVTFFLFERVQSAGEQHRYLFVPYVVIGISILLLSLSRRKKRWLQILITTITLGLSIWNIGMAYTDFTPAVSAGKLMTQVHMEPDIRNDLDTIRNILSYVNEKTDEDHELVYVVGDSDVMSQEVLKRAFMPAETNAAKNVISGSIIDLRDGFPSSAFIGDYVLVAIPMQSEHGAGREVIAQLYELFEENLMTADFYEVIQTENCDEIAFKLYHRVKPVTKEYVDELKATLQAYYPDAPFVYEPNYFLALISLDTPNNYSYYSWGPIVEFVPENGAAVNWETSKAFTSLSIDYVNWNEGVTYTAYADGVAVEKSNVEIGNANMTFDVTGVSQFTLVFESASMNGAHFSMQTGALQ